MLLVAVLVLTTAAVITLRVVFAGPALAARVCARLNSDMRGRVAIASIDWPMSSVPTLVGGGWVPVVLRDVQIRDADGVVVLRSPQIRAEIDVHAVLFGHHDVMARKVVMQGGEIVVREVGDTAVSLIAAFESRARPAGARAPAGARLELRDAEVRGVTVTVRALPVDAAATQHEVRATVSGVSARGSLAYDPRSSPPRLAFQTAPRGDQGELVVAGRRVALASVDVQELAQEDTTITFAAVVALAGGEGALVAGTLIDYWPNGHFGRDSRLLVTVSGLHATVPLTPPVEVTLAPLVLTHDLATGEGHLEDVRASGANTSVRASGRWGGGPDGAAPTWAIGAVSTDEAIDLSPWIRPEVKRELGHTLHGSVGVSIDLATDGLVHIGSPDLRLGRLHLDAGTLVIERARRLRIEGLHYAVPGLEGTYDCTVDPGPPVRRSCDGSSSGDARVLLRLRKLDTW